MAAPTHRPSRTRRLGRRILAPAIAAACVIASAPSSPAHAIGPSAVYEQWVGGPTVAVGGTFTPLVGNFAGGRGEDIFWYAPGPAPDYLWISSTTRGSWTKVRKDVGGTYVPLVGDFAGDTYDDILWYGPGTTPDTLWTSVDNTAYFTPKPYSINGTYQPIALDKAIPWASAVLSGGTPNYASTTKDHIVWYRPGAPSDLVWRFDQAGGGGFTQVPIAIDGSPRLVALNVDADVDEDLFAYQAGSGADALFTETGGVYAKTAKPVNGTYTPVVLAPGYRSRILWHGPGSAPDAYWSNGDWSPPLTSVATDPVTTAGPIPSTSDGTGFLFDPIGPDRLISGGSVVDALDPEQTGTARILVGDFDNDLADDLFFYRPGAGAEIMAFDQAPIFIA